MTGANSRLNEPYLLGGSTPGDGDTSLPVVIDGRSYLIDTSRQTNQSERFRRSSIQLLNSQQNIDKGESALTTPEVWRRTYKSWHHGMGQSFADREDSDPYRYDWSKGIDVWSRWQIGLLHETAQRSVLPPMAGLSVNGIVVAQSTNKRDLFLTDGLLTKTHALTEDSLLSTDGYSLYVFQGATNTLRTFTVSVSGGQIAVTEKSQTTTHFDADDKPVLVVFANFKLIAATASGKVYDVTAYLGGTKPTALPAAVYTPPVPNVRFVSGCAGRKAVYLLSVTGDKSVIHGFTVRPDATVDTLLYDGVAAELPDGETGRCLYSYLGYVAIGTSKGFRFAAAGEGVTYGPLIETPGPVTAFEGQGRFLYFALSNYRGDTGIGRADLSEFVADLQPAYAADLMTTGSHSSGEVSFISTLPSGRIVFGVTDYGVWQEQETYVESGDIVLSAFTFNVVDPKVGLYVATQTSVDSGGSGSLWACLDNSGGEVFLGEYRQAQQRFSMSGKPFYSAALHGTLERNPSDHTKTPLIYSVEMRATYVRGKASEWQVPCILHDEIEQDNGAVQARDVVSDYEHLLALCESGRTFTYVEDGLSWTVVATDYIWSPHERSAYTGWQGVFTIYFREVR